MDFRMFFTEVSSVKSRRLDGICGHIPVVILKGTENLPSYKVKPGPDGAGQCEVMPLSRALLSRHETDVLIQVCHVPSMPYRLRTDMIEGRDDVHIGSMRFDIDSKKRKPTQPEFERLAYRLGILGCYFFHKTKSEGVRADWVPSEVIRSLELYKKFYAAFIERLAAQISDCEPYKVDIKTSDAVRLMYAPRMVIDGRDLRDTKIYVSGEDPSFLEDVWPLSPAWKPQRKKETKPRRRVGKGKSTLLVDDYLSQSWGEGNRHNPTMSALASAFAVLSGEALEAKVDEIRAHAIDNGVKEKEVDDIISNLRRKEGV